MADISNIADRIGLPNHMKILLMDRENPQLEKGEYTVLVNPSSYSVSYGTDYKNTQPIGATDSSYMFNKVESQEMTIDLLFDSTGSLGKLPLIAETPVLDQIEQFLSIAHIVKKTEGEDPIKIMKIIWGPMEFLGLLTAVKITYSHFDTTGAPIRAKAKCTFSGGDVKFELSEQAKKQRAKSPEERKVVDFTKEKHAVNALQKYGTYIAVVAQQPESTMPKSLRIASEIAKMIIK
jgi:hypothetical protein